MQLGDILQSIPEVYEHMIALGGDGTKNRMVQISQAISSPPYKGTMGTDPELFVTMRMIFECHASGLRLCQTEKATPSDKTLREWDSSFQLIFSYLL